jgi:predicted ester cyclase
MSATAVAFFEACDAGKGWEVCKAWCHEGASFACQANTLAEVTTLDAYTDWMQGFYTPVPDFTYEIKACATDDERASVSVFAVGHGTHTGEGGPVPPTGNKVTADYVYVMDFDGDKIRHMTKIWNDGHTLKQLGWA